MKIKKFLIVITALLTVLLITYISLRYLYPQKYSDTVSKYSKEYGLDESIVYAIIKCESNFNSNALSNAGAVGLMQITPDTYTWAANKINDTDGHSLYDVDINIKYGCYIFSLFLNEFGVEETALASYNAGRGRVLSWLNNTEYSEDGIILTEIPYKETSNYVKKVLLTQNIYRFLY